MWQSVGPTWAPLDHQPVQGVIGVGGPDPVRPRQHAQIRATAAGGAGLDLHPRMLPAQLVEHGIEALHMGVRGHAAVRAARVRDIPVHVPLDVADRQRPQQGVDPGLDVGAHVVAAEVEDELVAEGQLRRRGGGQNPVRMGPEQVAVRIDHFRLEPQAELHAQALHVPGQRTQSVRIDGRVHLPVAEARPVVAAAQEPPVVEDEALDTDGGSLVGQTHQDLGLVVEIDGLPGVVVDRSGLGPQPVMLGAAPHMGMEGPGRAAPSLIGPGAVEGRAQIRLAGSQAHLAWAEQFPHLHIGPAVGQGVGPEPVIAAPAQMKGVDLAAQLAARIGFRPQARKGIVAGAPAAVFLGQGTAKAGDAAGLKLSRPATLEGGPVGDAAGQGQGRSVAGLQHDLAVAGVVDAGGHDEHVLARCQLHLVGEADPVGAVRRLDEDPARRIMLQPGDVWPEGPVPSVPMEADPWPTGETVAGQGAERQRRGPGRRTGGLLPGLQQGHCRQIDRRTQTRPEIDQRRSGPLQVQNGRGPGTVQTHERRNVGSGRGRR